MSGDINKELHRQSKFAPDVTIHAFNDPDHIKEQI